MKLLADENISRQIVEQLRRLGHQVLWASESAAGADDSDWLETGEREGRLLITDDKDFGELVFRQQLASAGVILLRMHRLSLSQKLSRLESLWPQILSRPPGSFVVVTDHSIRVRPPGRV
ncbi:MAG TPA: DUF5615 family PIN-like protein [Tepidisphaeraceae bacterium]|jgi:predicted nuclease of predicted toxin-antitoxin system|nr:DUF5615 family PIN-like protein [Tepidisphaeraceae bacterium]